MGKRKKRKRPEKQTLAYSADQDEYFYFIADYTEGGFPIGITWEEAEEQGLIGKDELREGRGAESEPDTF